MRILYHISMDDRFKSMFAYTDCIPQVGAQPALMQASVPEPPGVLHERQRYGTTALMTAAMTAYSCSLSFTLSR